MTVAAAVPHVRTLVPLVLLGVCVLGAAVLLLVDLRSSGTARAPIGSLRRRHHHAPVVTRPVSAVELAAWSPPQTSTATITPARFTDLPAQVAELPSAAPSSYTGRHREEVRTEVIPPNGL